MKPEIEAKFLRVDVDVIRKRLTDLQAECKHPMRLMRRVTYHTPEMLTKRAYMRVRDEGNRTTFTYKQFDSKSVDGAKEVEVIVSSFDDTIAILKQAGHDATAYQETKRETWLYNDTEIVIDIWPWLSPYIEIEGANEVSLRVVAELLGLNWSDAVFGDVMQAYRGDYPFLTETQDINQLAKITFSDTVPDLLIQNK